MDLSPTVLHHLSTCLVYGAAYHLDQPADLQLFERPETLLDLKKAI